MNNFDVPEVILERYNQLCDLVEKSQNGRLKTSDVAEYLGRNPQWLRQSIKSGNVPFALAGGEGGKTEFYIGILPLFMFELNGFTEAIKSMEVKK